ncbi:type I restriction-modification system methyltransferase subunit [Belliella baltica DSM 15883]|uniref:site-specific DNA-methyltransferase (adenine-specific) n=1 Tax=Belliella baltica (strain DSM 15883 / CIP 108006 / LMG 21964 / BA134) TaxID=866536 RepID=I3Z0K4_BELBD|nr:class I SAM-dependent DNA methyltransferase [Belliella baltica]AFL82772.1 type I restriction-modification system methyltransferase subunit [Belliella baltica DSM 15883]
MAKQKVKEKAIEETLWQSCDKLRGSVEPAEYKHVVLGLIFLKFASDKFEQRRKELIAEGKEKYVEMKDFYAMKNVFYLEEISRWSYIIKNAKQNDISLKIDTALNTIEKNNPALKGALPDNYFSRLALDKTKLASLLDTINDIDTLKDNGQDVIGRVYEYFLGKFALKESSGKGKGEFYTPKTIVNLMAELIEPYKGIIYDPCCGTGGMFVQSIKFIEAHQGSKKEVSIYGQENTPTTYKLAKMNLAIRGIAANLGDKHADTFSNDQHKDLKADYIMANPPFNLKDWRGENELLDDPRWMGYEVPPKSNANYGWILNMVSKLSENGVAGFILANGALSGSGEEYKIRRKLIENDLVEAIIIIPRNTFYTTDISVTLWILNKNKNQRTDNTKEKPKNYRDRTGEILFMDLRRWGSEYEKKYIELTEDDIQQVALNFHNWQQADYETTYKDIPEYCKSASFEDLEANDFSLVPSKYIEFVDKDSGIDFDTEMKRIQQDFKTLLQEEKESQEQLINAFKTLGYSLEP